MGVAPYYRGNGCNFWAGYDHNFHLIGATIHFISKGLDSGNIIKTVVPKNMNMSLNLYSMYAVRVVHQYIAHDLNLNVIDNLSSYKQDSSKLIRYTKRDDFDDKIINKYYKKNIKNKIVKKMFTSSIKLDNNQNVIF